MMVRSILRRGGEVRPTPEASFPIKFPNEGPESSVRIGGRCTRGT
ncbi:MAG: hypothetical protein RLY72_1440, partial [Planctomycetota bacterium]